MAVAQVTGFCFRSTVSSNRQVQVCRPPVRRLDEIDLATTPTNERRQARLTSTKQEEELVFPSRVSAGLTLLTSSDAAKSTSLEAVQTCQPATNIWRSRFVPARSSAYLAAVLSGESVSEADQGDGSVQLCPKGVQR